MHKRLLKIILCCFILFAVIQCSKEENKNSQKTKEKKVEQKEQEIQFQPTIKIEKIQKLTVDKWVTIYLSQLENDLKNNLELKKYAKESNLSEAALDKEIEERKKKLEAEFFKAWGITKEEFENFSVKNEQEIQRYIDMRPDVQEFIDKIQELNIKLYGNTADDIQEFNEEEKPE